MEIIVDDREHSVIPYLADQSADFNIDYKIQRNEVGDYAIVYREHIMIVIERKSWADLSASMRDGRKANLAKLINLRESTGCQIAYLIEGDPLPRPTKLIGRIPAKNLRAHLDHIAFRDGVHMVYSRSMEDSAFRLFELAQNLCTIKPSMFTEIDDLIVEKQKTKTNRGGSEEGKEENREIKKPARR